MTSPPDALSPDARGSSVPRSALGSALGSASGSAAAGTALPGSADAGPVLRGGRRAAEERLAAIDPVRYGASRNHLDGAVTRLSPAIRHGVLTLAEVRQAVFDRLAQSTGAAAQAVSRQAGEGQDSQEAAPRRLGSIAARRAGDKLIQELGWRDYWQRLWIALGDGIWHDREPLRTGHPPQAYAAELPADLAAAATGLACIDAFATELMGRGWLHNHARLWLAAYVVHWRRVRWQAGARWFLRHLLDGDPASNNLSWQWVASSFSAKPYFFNRDNLERFSSGRFCATCPLADRGGAGVAGGCPFEASYEALQAKLFQPLEPAAATASRPAPSLPSGASAPAADAALGGPSPGGEPPPRRPLVWVHHEALGPANPALRAHPGAPALAVLDAAWIAGGPGSGGPDPEAWEEPPAAGRLRFLRQCLAELPVTVVQGDGVGTLRAAAIAHGADAIVTSRPVDPRLRRIVARLATELPVRLLEPEPFVDLPLTGPGSPDLRRFSRYWRQAEPLVWGERSHGG